MTILTTLSKFAMYLLSALLVLAIGVDWFFYLTVRRTYDLVAEDSRSIHRIICDRGPYLPPSGLNVKGERFSTDESVEFWAVRFASKDCHFCENDQPIWARLDASLRQNGYKVFTLVAVSIPAESIILRKKLAFMIGSFLLATVHLGAF